MGRQLPFSFDPNSRRYERCAEKTRKQSNPDVSSGFAWSKLMSFDHDGKPTKNKGQRMVITHGQK